MSDTVDNVMDAVSEAVASGADEPADVVVNEETSLVNEEETSVEEEAPVASETEEAPDEEEAPVASETEEAPVASASGVEETSPEEVAETEEASVEPEVAPIEQVVSDIRDILSEDSVTSASEASELTEDLKQRIAELDYLRELYENLSNGNIENRNDIIKLWNTKSILVSSDVDYLIVLNNLEKLPNIIRKSLRNKEANNSELFININNIQGKIEKLEELINIMNISIRKVDIYLDNF